jgi:hypothetical protein
MKQRRSQQLCDASPTRGGRPPNWPYDGCGDGAGPMLITQIVSILRGPISAVQHDRACRQQLMGPDRAESSQVSVHVTRRHALYGRSLTRCRSEWTPA